MARGRTEAGGHTDAQEVFSLSERLTVGLIRANWHWLDEHFDPDQPASNRTCGGL